MYTDIFRFNIRNIRSNLMIMVILSILLQKCIEYKVFIGVRVNMKYIITIIIFRLTIAIIPNRLILQGGINI